MKDLWQKGIFRWLVILGFAVNVAVAIFLSLFHQRGVVDVMYSVRVWSKELRA
jgi:hypothetical protein